MKHALLVISAAVLLFSCNKTNTSTEPPVDEGTTNGLNGQWKLTMYDSTVIDTITSTVTYSFFDGTASTGTKGSASFTLVVNGGTPDTENASYLLSNNNKNISFTKTGGNSSHLSGGGTWTIDSLTANLVQMRCATNKCIRMRR